MPTFDKYGLGRPNVFVGSIFFSQCAENVSQTGELCGRIKHKVGLI